MIHQADLHQVLSNRTGLNVILVGLRDPAQEVHGVGIAQVVLECLQSVSFSTEDFVDSEAIISNMNEIADVRRQDLLVLGGDEHGSDTNQLKLVQGDNLYRQEAIDNVDGKEESLGQQPEPSVNLNQPVDEDASHLPLEVFLVLHIVGVGHGRLLQLLVVVEDLSDVLSTH